MENTNKHKMIAETIKERYKTMSDNQNLYYYNDDGYFVRGESKLLKYCGEINATTHDLKEITHFIKAATQTNRSCFGLKEGFLNLRNGVLDIRKMVLLPHDPKYCFLNRLEIQYAVEATCPMWDMVLERVPDVKLLQKWFAYHLLSGQMHKKSMFMVGKTDSGRSLILNVLESFVGRENVTNFQFRQFAHSESHAVIGLYGKLSNIHPDLSYSQINDASDFKAIVGGDTVTSREHYKEPISFKVDAKLTFATNKLPWLGENLIDDEAFWNRIILMKFPNSISKEEQIPNLGTQISVREMSGVLNWAIKAYDTVIIEGFPITDFMTTRMQWLDISSHF